MSPFYVGNAARWFLGILKADFGREGGLVLKDRGEVSPAGGETLLRKIKIGGGRNQKWGVSFKRATKVSREVKRAGRQEAGKVPRLSAQTEENKSK